MFRVCVKVPYTIPIANGEKMDEMKGKLGLWVHTRIEGHYVTRFRAWSFSKGAAEIQDECRGPTKDR